MSELRTKKEIRDRIKSILAEKEKYPKIPSNWYMHTSFSERVSELVWVLNQS